MKNYLEQLLNHKSMKTAGMVLHLKNGQSWILGRLVKIKTTSSGYCLPLTNTQFKNSNSRDIAFPMKSLKWCS